MSRAAGTRFNSSNSSLPPLAPLPKLNARPIAASSLAPLPALLLLLPPPMTGTLAVGDASTPPAAAIRVKLRAASSSASHSGAVLPDCGVMSHSGN
jgi:hypothetical protein